MRKLTLLFSFAIFVSPLAALHAWGDPVDDAVAARQAAERGDPIGQAQLGLMYANGSGVPKDDREAVAWYRKSADQGLALAQLMLGHMYFKGRGVPEDMKQALFWYRKAADQDNDGGQNMVGTMYQFGQGVKIDIPEAISWYRRSAAHGNTHAKDSLRELGAPWVDERNTAPASVSKEDLRDMIQAAVKTNAESRAPAAPKAIVSDVDKPAYATPENADNFAVVIGVEKYASLPAADFADRDAEAVRAHLLASGYPARNIFFLGGQQATRAKIAQSVNTWLPGRVTPASTVFFYYSGHGAPDPKTSQAYLVPMDGDPEDLDSTSYPIKLLYEKLGKLKARQVIVALDSCFSGAGGRSVLAKGTRPLVGRIDMGGLPDNVVALTASDKSQISGTLEDQGHGAFTYYMLKGLSGEAKNGDGHVTLQSLYKYLTPKVQDAARMHNRDQTPQLLNAKQAGAALR